MKRLSMLSIVPILCLSASICDADVPVPANGPPYTMAPTSCSALGPAILDLVDHTGQALIEATRAGFAADNLKSGGDYKTVEDSSAKVHEEVIKAYLALGPVMTANISDARVTSATATLANEAQGELQVAQQLAFLSLNYERTDNSARRRRRMLWEAAPFLLVAPIAAGGYLSGVAGAHTTTSQTTGTIDGQPFSATTTTQSYAEARALNAAIASNQTERKQALELYTPQVGNLVYVIHPLADKWVDACRAAHELAPAPSLANEIKMAKEALAKGISPDAVLRMFMQRTGLSEREARTYLGLPQKE